MSKSVFSLAVFGGFCLLGVTSNAHADCDNSTLRGRYAFRTEASPTTGGRRLNLALVEFKGDGTFDNLGFTTNTDGTIATGTVSGGRYQINANCSGTFLNPDGSVAQAIIVAEDGSEFYSLRTNPSTLMLVGIGTRIERKAPGEEEDGQVGQKHD